MICEYKKLKKKKLCIGDLRKKITVYDRSIKPAETSSEFENSQTFSNAVIYWCAIETKTGVEIFDGSNLLGSATHIFYIKYVESINTENTIKWNNKYYTVLQVDNVNEENEYLAIFCSERGTTSNGVNWQ